MTAMPIDTAADQMAAKALHLAVLEPLIRRQPIRFVARQNNITRYQVEQITGRYGWPDREAMRRAAVRLRSDLAHYQADEAPEEDHPAVDLALRLSAAIRDLDPRPVADLLEHTDRAGLVVLLTTFAAMVPPDTDPVQALEWIDVPADEWSPETVAREEARWRAGARDRTAVSGHERAPQN